MLFFGDYNPRIFYFNLSIEVQNYKSDSPYNYIVFDTKQKQIFQNSQNFVKKGRIWWTYNLMRLLSPENTSKIRNWAFCFLRSRKRFFVRC